MTNILPGECQPAAARAMLKLAVSVTRFCLVILVAGCLRAVNAQVPPTAVRLSDSSEVNIPFRYEPPLMPFIIVQASIDGRPPLPFLVDTGVSTGLLIDTAAARKLQLHPNGLRARGNGSVEVVGVDIRSVSLVGAADGERLECAQSDAFLIDLSLLDGTYTGPRIAGIIGAPLLSPFAVRLDFTRRLLTVYTSGIPPIPPDNATIVPMKARSDGYNVIVSPQKGITVRAVVDTGAIGSSLPVSIAGFLRPKATIMGRYLQVGFAMFGDRWRLPTWQIGDITETDVALAAAPSFTFAALGLDLLSRFRVTLDFPHGKLILERDADAGRRRHLRGWTGIELESSGKGFRVRALDDRSPAGHMGIGRGTEVIAIDGQRLEGLPPTVAESLLSGLAGVPTNLTVRRGGRQETVTLLPATEFDAPPSLLAGTVLQKPDGGSFLVLWVAEGAVSERAGLVVHDEIISLNGVSAASLTPAEVWQQIHAPKITLRVRRRGQPRPRVVTLTDPRDAHAH